MCGTSHQLNSEFKIVAVPLGQHVWSQYTCEYLAWGELSGFGLHGMQPQIKPQITHNFELWEATGGRTFRHHFPAESL